MSRRSCLAALAAALLACALTFTARAQSVPAPDWRGYKVFTNGIVSTNIWVLAAPTGSGGLAQNFPPALLQTLAGKGIMVVGVHWKGADFGEEDFGARYFLIGAFIQEFKASMGIAVNPVLYSQSRGGLQNGNFACEAASLVLRHAMLYPVTDPAVYPGRGGALGNAHNKADREFDAVMPNSADKILWQYSPNLKAAGCTPTPTMIWHGTNDQVVPKALTTDIFAPLAHAVVKSIPGFGHEAPSDQTVYEIAEFIQWGSFPPGSSYQ